MSEDDANTGIEELQHDDVDDRQKKNDFYQTVVAARGGVKRKSMSNKIQKSYVEEFDRCFAARDF